MNNVLKILPFDNIDTKLCLLLEMGKTDEIGFLISKQK